MAASKGALRPKDDRCAALGRQFRSTREAAGLTLRALAPSVGVCFYTIRKHEAGMMMLRIDDLIRAAEAMRVPVDELVVTP